MSKSERLIYILSLLSTHRYLKARDLAERCEVSERTIYRDIISISGTNIPIYFQNGYKLIHQDFLPPYNFTMAETEYLIKLLSLQIKDDHDRFNGMAERIVDKIRATKAHGDMSHQICNELVAVDINN
jgi:predicted DNA-binding transcriptional regulator YafY